MKFNHLRNPHFLAAIFIIASLSTFSVWEYNNIATFNHNYLHLGKETITIKIDGKQVYYAENTISVIMYDYVICKIFNDTTACQAANGYYGAGASGVVNGCHTYTGNGNSQTGVFYSKNMCSALGMVFSSDTSTPVSTNPVCSVIFNSNGVLPKEATTSHAANTNTIILSQSWTATGTVNGIAKICLFPWDDKNNLFVTNNAGWALAIDLLSPSQSLTNGQAISAQWTFSF